MNGHDLQVIRNPDREDRRRFMAVVNRRPLDPPTQTAGQAKQKAINYVFGFHRKPKGQSWDWSQVKPVADLEAALDANPVPGTGPQPDVPPEAQPDPQPEAQPEAQADLAPDLAPDLTDDQADRVLDAIFSQVDPQPDVMLPAPVAVRGTVHEVRVDFTAVFQTTDPESIVSQVKIYIQSLRDDLGGDVDCQVSQPPIVRI
jgi:hypothetical protein